MGSAGISLSGGQKQRLALARAVYARKELIIIDDVFSGLDASTEDHICTCLFGKTGLFRKLGITVLIATHAVQRLSFADYVVALDSAGRVVEQGPFQHLRSTGGYVQSLASKLKEQGVSEAIEQAAQIPPSSKHPTLISDDEEHDIISGELSRQSGDLAVYKYYFASTGWVNTSIFFCGILVFGVGNKMSEFLLTYWTAAVTKDGNSANARYLGAYAALSLTALSGIVVGVYYFGLFMVPRSASLLHSRLLRIVMGAPLSFFTTTDTGVTTNRLVTVS